MHKDITDFLLDFFMRIWIEVDAKNKNYIWVMVALAIAAMIHNGATVW